MSDFRFELPMFERLQPRTPWNGGRMAEMDILTLADAARFASAHAKAEVTEGDFVRAAARGEILLRAICRRSVSMLPCIDGDAPLDVSEGSLPTLPLVACKVLAVSGNARWRTYDDFKSLPEYGGIFGRFARWRVPDGEPDLESTLDDCRVLGADVHALADAFTDAAGDTTPIEKRKKVGAGETARDGKEWTDAEEDQLLKDLETMSQQAAGAKYGVSKARIFKVAQRARERHGKPENPTMWDGLK